MISYQFKDKLQEKDCVGKFFPEFIRPDFSVVQAISKEEIEKKYQAYCDEYFTKYNSLASVYLVPIKVAYQYLIQAKENEETPKFTHLEIQELYDAYERVLFSVGQYGFNPTHESSTGEHQNNTNRNIMLELSMFRDFVIQSLTRLDKKIPSDEEVETTDFDWEILDKVERLTSGLNASYHSLNEAEALYHETWNQATNRGIILPRATKKDLGETKKAWRFVKNEACQELIVFFQTLNSINRSLNKNADNAFQKESDQLSKNLYEGLENIKYGPNYYSYLDPLTAKRETEGNKCLKKMGRITH